MFMVTSKVTPKNKAAKPTPDTERMSLHVTYASVLNSGQQMDSNTRGDIELWAKQKERLGTLISEKKFRIPIGPDLVSDAQSLADECRAAGWTVKLDCAQGADRWEITLS
jgi:hypothetical protein